MEMRQLGKNGPPVSAIGFGAWAMGGRGWGQVDDDETVAAVRRSVELGSTFLDTAEVYGDGQSEELIGRALSGGLRKEVFLATKVGGSDLSRKRIAEAIDNSLRRLQTDYVDLYQLHWPDEKTPVEESMQAMDDLVKAGKVRYVGVSNFDVPLMTRCLAVRHVDSLQPVYSMLNRGIEKEILPFCQQQGIGAVVYSPMAKGLLTGKYSPDATFSEGDVRQSDPLFQGERFRKNLELVERLKRIAQEHNATVVQLALNWTLQHPAVTVAIAGAKRPAQVAENVGGQGWQLTAQEKSAIEGWLSALPNG
ncbi:MAG: aldo/keto reductase [Chloroflexota bacterium]